MNIQIYQVNMKRDTNNVAFMNYESLPKFQGSSEIDSSVYDKVFEGDVNCKTLEEVYQMFNSNHPAGYKARSLSVSDVVEVIQEDGTRDFHFCDSFGFRKVAFEPDKCEISERFCSGEGKDTVSVLLIQPEKRCYIKEREMIEIMAGDFFICYAPISSEKFLSLPPDLEKKYAEKFRYPETFVRTNDGIKAIPYKPKTKDFER